MVKALKSKPFNYQAARAFLDRKLAREAQENERLWRRARRDFKKILALIVTKYRPTRIYQWGSLLDKDHFNERSDLDIAVEGVKSAKDFFAIYGDADALTGFPLDLVELDKIHPLHAESIRKNGRLVYERPS